MRLMQLKLFQLNLFGRNGIWVGWRGELGERNMGFVVATSKRLCAHYKRVFVHWPPAGSYTINCHFNTHLTTYLFAACVLVSYMGRGNPNQQLILLPATHRTSPHPINCKVRTFVKNYPSPHD